MYNPIIRIYANNNALEQCKKYIFQIKTSKIKKVHSTENQKDEQHGSHRKNRDEPRCWQDVEVNRWCTITCLDHFCLIYVFKQAFLIPYISLSLNRNIATIQLALRHDNYLIEYNPKHTNNTASSAS